MPNIKAAIKRVRKVKTQTVVNRVRKSKYRLAIKKMNSLILDNKKSEALKFLPKLNSQLMKISKTGVVDKKLRQEIFQESLKELIKLNNQS